MKKKRRPKKPKIKGAAKHRTLIRSLSILRLLAEDRAGLTADEITSRFDVTKRTIYRDLKAIESAGFTLERAYAPPSRQPTSGILVVFRLARGEMIPAEEIISHD